MDDVRGDFLGPPHGTTPAAVIANKMYKFYPKIVLVKNFSVSTIRRDICDFKVRILYIRSVAFRYNIPVLRSDVIITTDSVNRHQMIC